MSKEKQIEETRKDLIEIFDEEYEKRRIITADFTAIKMTAKGYRKQSENTVELPCKVGETIYLPWEFDGIKSIAYLTVTHIIFDRRHNYVKTDFSTDDEAYYDKYKCGRYEFEDFGKIVFLTREEAEAKMKGGAE